jgi:hypothetical protein
MNTDFIFIMMKDDAYDSWEMPHLPLPVRVGELTESLKNGHLDNALLVSCLQDYLTHNPQEEERYRSMLAKLAFWAGIGLLRRGMPLDLLAARPFFEIANQHEPGNVETLCRLAVTWYYSDYEEFTRIMGEAIMIAIKDDRQMEDPFPLMTVAYHYFNLREYESGELVWLGFTYDRFHRLTPPEQQAFREKILRIGLENNYHAFLDWFFQRR